MGPDQITNPPNTLQSSIVFDSPTAGPSATNIPSILPTDLSFGGGVNNVRRTAAPSQPPPIPPRPTQTSSLYNNNAYGMGRYMGGYSGVGGMYGGYSSYGSPFSGIGSYGGYGGLGSYGGQYPGAYGNGTDISQLAEERARSAFQSVESVVQVFNSVSMMLESTYFALQSTFRAVIGVADQMSRLKDHIAHVLSMLAIVRTLRWLVRKCLYYLGFVNENPERLWNAAQTAATEISTGPPVSTSQSLWPITMFLGLVMGAPWLIYRLFRDSMDTRNTAWANGQADHYNAVGEFDFRAQGSNELSVAAGQHIRIAPKELQPQVRDWLLASTDGSKTGLVPANYVKILGFQKVQLNAAQPSTSSVNINTQQQAHIVDINDPETDELFKQCEKVISEQAKAPE